MSDMKIAAILGIVTVIYAITTFIYVKWQEFKRRQEVLKNIRLAEEVADEITKNRLNDMSLSELVEYRNRKREKNK